MGRRGERDGAGQDAADVAFVDRRPPAAASPDPRRSRTAAVPEGWRGSIRPVRCFVPERCRPSAHGSRAAREAFAPATARPTAARSPFPCEAARAAHRPPCPSSISSGSGGSRGDPSSLFDRRMSRNAFSARRPSSSAGGELRVRAHGRCSLLCIVEARDDLPLGDARADDGVDGDHLSGVARSDAYRALDRQPSRRAQQAGDVSGRHQRRLASARCRGAESRIPRGDRRRDATIDHRQTSPRPSRTRAAAACGVASASPQGRRRASAGRVIADAGQRRSSWSLGITNRANPVRPDPQVGPSRRRR